MTTQQERTKKCQTCPNRVGTIGPDQCPYCRMGIKGEINPIYQAKVEKGKETLDYEAANAQARDERRLGGVCYGFRIRCRYCLDETQVNLPSHAVQFMEKHAACLEAGTPQL